MSSTKVLACGSVAGKFSKLSKKVASIHKKNGPFEMVVCTGDFFTTTPECKKDWEKFINNGDKFCIPVYILGPTSKDLESYFGGPESLEDGAELGGNVVYLGRKGIFKTTSGLVIGYLSGNVTSDGVGIKKEHVTSLLDHVMKDDSFSGVDLLITSTWPKDVNKNTKIEISTPNFSPWVSLLAATLKPRYHLSCHTDKFLERPPYRNHQVLRGSQEHVSRFIALAPFGNQQSEKAVYALSLVPITSMSHTELVKQPENVTEFPYTEVVSSGSNKTEENEKPQQFFFDANPQKRKHDQSDGGQGKRTPKGPPSLKGDCWFCLGSKDVEKQLIISVGEQCYLAFAKGAINNDHVLICPVQHHNSTVVAPDDVVMEMEKFKLGLREMFKSEGKQMVTYERNYYTQHLQLQVIGIPEERCDEIKDTFIDLAEEALLEMTALHEDKDISDMVATTTPYFSVELPNGERLLHKVKGKMPLQFGREVLTNPSVLNLPHRVDWKECKLTNEQETIAVKKLRKRFQPYDFNFT